MNRHLSDDERLDEMIAGLPRETEPPRDFWPDVRERIRLERRTAAPAGGSWTHHALRAAAAVVIFCLGAVVGRAFGPDGAVLETAAPDEPLAAAAEVQRAGTAYVAALARFRATASSSPDPVVDQARQVALAAVHGAAWELLRMTSEDATAREIVSLAGEGRGDYSSEEIAP